MNFNIKDVVKDNVARFSHYRDGTLYYEVRVPDGRLFTFPITIEEAKGGTFLAQHAAINLMRWIRKAMEDKTFQPAK